MVAPLLSLLVPAEIQLLRVSSGTWLFPNPRLCLTGFGSPAEWVLDLLGGGVRSDVPSYAAMVKAGRAAGEAAFHNGL